MLCSDLSKNETEDYIKMTDYLYKLKIEIDYKGKLHNLLENCTDKYLSYLLEKYPITRKEINSLYYYNNEYIYIFILVL